MVFSRQSHPVCSSPSKLAKYLRNMYFLENSQDVPTCANVQITDTTVSRMRKQQKAHDRIVDSRCELIELFFSRGQTELEGTRDVSVCMCDDTT